MFSIVTVNEWQQYSQQNINLSKKEVTEASFLFDECNQLISNVGIKIGEQIKSVNSALRERIHDLKQVIDKLNWEKKQVCGKIISYSFNS